MPKGLQSAARIIFARAQKFHTGSLRGIFPHAHVALKNDPNFLRLRAQTLRGFYWGRRSAVGRCGGFPF